MGGGINKFSKWLFSHEWFIIHTFKFDLYSTSIWNGTSYQHYQRCVDTFIEQAVLTLNEQSSSDDIFKSIAGISFKRNSITLKLIEKQIQIIILD